MKAEVFTDELEHGVWQHWWRKSLEPLRAHESLARSNRGARVSRHHVENFFGRIKAHRRISTGDDKLAETFLAFVQLAAALDWLTDGYSNTP